MQLMRKETDDRPILIDTGMNIKAAKWNPNGNVLAVAGSLAENSDGKGIV
jgi:WD repeat-containing protein 35